MLGNHYQIEMSKLKQSMECYQEIIYKAQQSIKEYEDYEKKLKVIEENLKKQYENLKSADDLFINGGYEDQGKSFDSNGNTLFTISKNFSDVLDEFSLIYANINNELASLQETVSWNNRNYNDAHSEYLRFSNEYKILKDM